MVGMDEEKTEVLLAGGRKRRCQVVVPAGAERPAPLLLALHGRLGSGDRMRSQSGFDAFSRGCGFLCAYPDGFRRSWADGRGITPADRAGIDDVRFLADLVDRIGERFSTDPARVVLVGHSNGGFMVFRLLAEMPGRFAGAAVLAASLPEALATRLAHAAPLPVLLLHGTADPIIPYAGMPVPGGGRVMGAQETAAWLARVNGCAETPRSDPGPIFSPSIRVDRLTYENGRAPVRLLHIQGGGHAWPGGRDSDPRWGPPVPCGPTWASKEILRFLSLVLGIPHPNL